MKPELEYLYNAHSSIFVGLRWKGEDETFPKKLSPVSKGTHNNDLLNGLTELLGQAGVTVTPVDVPLWVPVKKAA
jgi:hypothetical protein